MAIKPIKNPYIPKDFISSLECCEGKTTNTPLIESVPQSWLTRYTQISPSEINQLRFDETGEYTPQGGCVYGGYIYRALVKEDNEPAKIQKIKIEDGSIELEKSIILGHANDMFIKEGKLYVLHSSSTNILYELNMDSLELIQSISNGPTRWGQAYNPVDKVDVIGTVGSAYFSIYINGSFMYRIKPDNAFSGLVRQGIFCTENYIGVVLDNAYGAVIDNWQGSRIMIYTFNGMFIKSIHVPIKEIEWADYVDGTIYLGTYEGRDTKNVKSGYIYAIPYDLYPEQTVLTGRPTDVSGGLNNLQRLPEGTPVKLWEGSVMDQDITLATANTRLKIDENGPFRYILFKFDGANACTFIWFPTNGGTVALRETDVTNAVSNSTIRHRETRLQFDENTQTFKMLGCVIEEIQLTASTNTIAITKNPAGVDCNKIRSIWGIV